MTESLTVNGQDVLSCALAFAVDLGGIGSGPPRRTANTVVLGRHGAVKTARKLYASNQVSVTLWVRGMNADGSYPSDRSSKFYSNLDQLMGYFSGTVTLVHGTPHGQTRQISGEVLAAVPLARSSWANAGNLAVTIECSDPFWREAASVSGSFSATSAAPDTHVIAGFAGSTAPVEDPVVVFTGPCTNPKMASGLWWVQYNAALAAGQSVTIDAGQWTVTGAGGVTADYSKLVHAGIGPWFALDPSPGGPSCTFSHTATTTGTATVTGKRAWLGG